MMDVLAFVFAVGLGFGAACWACGTLLEKSNNIGDSVGSKGVYGAFVNFTAKKDRLNKNDRSNFCHMYAQRIEGENSAPASGERVHRRTEEELQRYEAQGAEITALSSPMRNPTEDEFSAWDENNPSGDLTNVFKPLDEDK